MAPFICGKSTCRVPWWHSGLRICHFHRCCSSTGFDPRSGNFLMPQAWPTKKKKKNQIWKKKFAPKLFFQVKEYSWKKKKATISACHWDNSTSAFPLGHHFSRNNVEDTEKICYFPIFLYMTLKRHVLKNWSLITIIFTVSSRKFLNETAPDADVFRTEFYSTFRN